MATISNHSAAALTARKLSVFFGANQVLKEVSLDVAAKAVTAIIGPSGCGKSTFLRALNRMHELNPEARMEGEIRLFGDDIYSRNVEPVVVRSIEDHPDGDGGFVADTPEAMRILRVEGEGVAGSQLVGLEPQLQAELTGKDAGVLLAAVADERVLGA